MKLFDKKNRVEILIVVAFGLLALVIFNWGVIHYNIKRLVDDNFISRERFNSSVATSIKRSLLLDNDSKDMPIVWGKRDGDRNPVCTIDQILIGGPEIYGTCEFVRGGSTDRCGTLFSDPECRTVEVSSQAWEVETIQRQIIYAALHPCDFLINTYEVDRETFSEKRTEMRLTYNFFGPEYLWHKTLWGGAGCTERPEGTGISITHVYFEIKDNDQIENVYKATIKNNEIRGEYTETLR